MRKQICRILATLALSVLTVTPVVAQGTAGNYLAARAAAMNSDYESAALYYTRLLARNSSDPLLLENLIMANMALGEVGKSIPVARRLDAIKEVNSQISNMALIAELAVKEDYEAVLLRLKAERGIGPLVDGLISAWSTLGKGDMNETLALFDALGAEQGLKGFALYHKALALASVGDFEAAEAIYSDQGSNGVQITRRAAIAHIEVLSQLDRNADAIEVLAALFGRDLDPELRALRDALESGERLSFTHIRSARDGLAEVFFTIASALQSESAPDYALLYTRIAEHLRPDHVDAILLSAELLEEVEQYALAEIAYRSVPRDDLAFHAAELGRADALRRSGKIEAAIEVLQQLTRSHADLPIVHTTLGDVLRQQQSYEDAAESYDRALALFDEPEGSQWFTYYARGICHERLGAWPKAEEDFRTALRLNPGQPQVLNYLGYSLVEKQIKLEEALGMIEEAVAARPDSGYIVDSLGWVLYRLGRYDEAVGHMERATELMPVDPVVNDHLGDVYWAVGRQTEAEFQWMRALSFIDENAPPEADPDRIRRKLELGLDAVLMEEGAEPITVANDG